MRAMNFTEQEFQALAGLLDAAVRGSGLRAVKDAAALLTKMEASPELPDHPPVESAPA